MNTIKRFFIYKGLFLLSLSFLACGQQSNGQSSEQETKKEEIETVEVKYVKVDPTEFKSKMEAEAGDFYLIDVRTKGEFEAGAIENAENYDIMNGDFQNKIADWNSETPIYVYCAKGGRSSQAAKILEEKGFKNIVELNGGYTAWK